MKISKYIWLHILWNGWTANCLKTFDIYKLVGLVGLELQVNSVRRQSVMTEQAWSTVWHILQSILLQSHYVQIIRSVRFHGSINDQSAYSLNEDETVRACKFIEPGISSLWCLQSASYDLCMAMPLVEIYFWVSYCNITTSKKSKFILFHHFTNMRTFHT